MTRKNRTASFGKSLLNEQKRRIEGQQRKRETEVFVPECAGEASRSILEGSSLDDLIATVAIRKDEWEDAYGMAEVMTNGPVLLDMNAPLVEVEEAAAKSRELVSIPRRPQWHEGMSVEELTQLESDAFLEWRRGLKQLEHGNGLVMTPYERNLDFWRQLWRCMERSDLLVQVLDARDPDFYFCQDLYQYVSELGGVKRLMLLVNKADYLTSEQRQQWANHFEAKGVDAIFFSALNELHKQEKATVAKAPEAQEDTTSPSTPADRESVSDAALPASNMEEATPAAELDAADIPVPDSSDDELAEPKDEAADASDADNSEDEGSSPQGLLLDDADGSVADVAMLLDSIRARLPKQDNDVEAKDRHKLGVVGFVGYPNVGKSTVINALVGAKKVGMSRTPGKTKHIQTLQLPEWGFILCDAPGLVFPSVVATRAHLVINNTVPLDDLRECFSPIRLIVEKIGFTEALRRYRCDSYVKDAAARSGDHVLDETHSFLAAFAVSRNHFLRVGVPDENWAARKVLRDYCTGKLLHCEPPPGVSGASRAVVDEAVECARTDEVNAGDMGDFGDLDELLNDASTSVIEMKMTKRKERHLLKQLSKGVAPAGFATKATAPGAGRRRENARAKALA